MFYFFLGWINNTMFSGSSSWQLPQIRLAPGFAHAFWPHSGQVYFFLLAFFVLAAALYGALCQLRRKPYPLGIGGPNQQSQQ
jgi:hypothetical protein